MEKIIRKNRERENRGVLKDFFDLPISIQNDFFVIKKTFQEEFGDSLNLCVFGSFYWGFWDDLSDYDLKIDYVFNNFKPDSRIEKIKEIKEKLAEILNKKIDVLIMRGDNGILIP